jgi:hypothetical protein
MVDPFESVSLKSLLEERLCRCDILDTYCKPPLDLFVTVKAAESAQGRVARSYLLENNQHSDNHRSRIEGQVNCSVNKLERVMDQASF